MKLKSLSFWISAVFHPLLMATYGCLLIFFFNQEYHFRLLDSLGCKMEDHPDRFSFLLSFSGH